MDTKLEKFDDTYLIIPTKDFIWPHKTFKGFPTSCGAGKGLGDRVVPDTIFLMKVSPACWVHDQMWSLSEPTWSDFHYSNSVFLENLRLINEAHTKFKLLKLLREVRIYTYYKMVNTVGAYFFWKLKSQQGRAKLEEVLGAIEEGKKWLKQ